MRMFLTYITSHTWIRQTNDWTLYCKGEAGWASMIGAAAGNLKHEADVWRTEPDILMSGSG